MSCIFTMLIQFGISCIGALIKDSIKVVGMLIADSVRTAIRTSAISVVGL